MQVKGGSQGTSTTNYKNIFDIRVERHVFFLFLLNTCLVLVLEKELKMKDIKFSVLFIIQLLQLLLKC